MTLNNRLRQAFVRGNHVKVLVVGDREYRGVIMDTISSEGEYTSIVLRSYHPVLGEIHDHIAVDEIKDLEVFAW